jgi:hypothetical protein
MLLPLCIWRKDFDWNILDVHDTNHEIRLEKLPTDDPKNEGIELVDSMLQHIDHTREAMERV